MATVSRSERKSLQNKDWNGIRWHGIYWVQNLIVLQEHRDRAAFIHIYVAGYGHKLNREIVSHSENSFCHQNTPVLVLLLFHERGDRAWAPFLSCRRRSVCCRVYSLCLIFSTDHDRGANVPSVQWQSSVCVFTLLFSSCLCSRTKQADVTAAEQFFCWHGRSLAALPRLRRERNKNMVSSLSMSLSPLFLSTASFCFSSSDHRVLFLLKLTSFAKSHPSSPTSYCLQIQ